MLVSFLHSHFPPCVVLVARWRLQCCGASTYFQHLARRGGVLAPESLRLRDHHGKSFQDLLLPLPALLRQRRPQMRPDACGFPFPNRPV